VQCTEALERLRARAPLPDLIARGKLGKAALRLAELMVAGPASACNLSAALLARLTASALALARGDKAWNQLLGDAQEELAAGGGCACARVFDCKNYAGAWNGFQEFLFSRSTSSRNNPLSLPPLPILSLSSCLPCDLIRRGAQGAVHRCGHSAQRHSAPTQPAHLRALEQLDVQRHHVALPQRIQQARCDQGCQGG
jgi:hypothetical protein